MEDTVESKLKECDNHIQHLKLNGISAVVIIALFECLVDIVRTLAVHTVKARIKTV